MGLETAVAAAAGEVAAKVVKGVGLYVSKRSGWNAKGKPSLVDLCLGLPNRGVGVRFVNKTWTQGPPKSKGHSRLRSHVRVTKVTFEDGWERFLAKAVVAAGEGNPVPTGLKGVVWGLHTTEFRTEEVHRPVRYANVGGIWKYIGSDVPYTKKYGKFTISGYLKHKYKQELSNGMMVKDGLPTIEPPAHDPNIAKKAKK